jgi:hypothetical protein
MTMQRRQFIEMTTMGGTVMLVTGMGCRQRHPVSYDLLDQPQELAQICDLKTLKEIGMAYRLQTTTETDANKLASLLLTDTTGKPVSSASDLSFIQSILANKIDQDFKTGNIVTVKGWILSRTEARQCALLFVNNQ